MNAHCQFLFHVDCRHALPATGGALGLRADPSGTPAVDHVSRLIPDHFSRLLTV